MVAVAVGSMAGTAAVLADHHRIIIEGFTFHLATPSTGALALLVVGLPIFNAVGEELVWRQWLASSVRWAAPGWAFLLQAGSFGIAHLHGIPAGPLGMVLAALFSAALFAVHRRWSFRAAVLAHIVTDLIIFWAVATNASFVTY